MVQEELFKEASPYGSIKAPPRSFLSTHRIEVSLDKVVFALIAVVIAFSVIFSMGVEHGKRAMEHKYETLLMKQSTTVIGAERSSRVNENEEVVLVVNQPEALPASPAAPAVPVAVPQEAAAAETVLNLEAHAGEYTVQLVTYKDEKLALQEVAYLNSKGHKGFIIPSGAYYQVCADFHKEKKEAKSKLENFGTADRYPDAYVRPVIR